jgi:transcriptional regulator with GAF, ATPase, and Fis domain
MDNNQTTLNNPSDKSSKLKSILSQAQISNDIATTIPELIRELKEVWQCEAITLYALDRENRQLFSRNSIKNLGACRA